MTIANDKTTNRRIIKLFAHHAWQHKKYVVGLSVCAPLFSLTFRFLPPLVVASILSRISQGQFTHGELWQSFGALLLAYAAMSIFGGILIGRLTVLFIWKLEMGVLKDMHQRIFDHLMVQSTDFHANRFGGSLVSQANKFAGAYIRMADTTVFQLAPLVLSFIFTIIILTPRAPMVSIFLILFSIIFMFISVKITKKVRELNALEAHASTRQTGFLADAITNVTAVKSFAREKFEKDRYESVTEQTRLATQNVMRASLVRDFFFATATTSLGTIALVLSVASVVLFKADIATVFLVVSYTGIIGQNLWDFSQSTLRNYNRALGDAAEMAQILAITPPIKDAEKPAKLHISEGSIEFADVTFTHIDDKDALFHELNLRIKAGEKIGLVGHSGSGKTTLSKLLLRFSDIEGGAILIDGQDISTISQYDLRSNVAYVPQEPLMFHRTIAENIEYGKPSASISQIVEAAKMAHAHEFIDKLPAKYETLVGERGVKLSGGQRQRIAIARAMLKNAPILLLDEATSALDSESEVLIQDALWKLMEGRTAIVIAHRLSTVQKMDRIIVLEDGKIVEQGSHTELLHKDGVYAGLWKHQSGGFIEE